MFHTCTCAPLRPALRRGPLRPKEAPETNGAEVRCWTDTKPLEAFGQTTTPRFKPTEGKKEMNEAGGRGPRVLARSKQGLQSPEHTPVHFAPTPRASLPYASALDRSPPNERSSSEGLPWHLRKGHSQRVTASCRSDSWRIPPCDARSRHECGALGLFPS